MTPNFSKCHCDTSESVIFKNNKKNIYLKSYP